MGVRDVLKSKNVRLLLEQSDFESELREPYKEMISFLLQPSSMGVLVDELMREPAPNSDAIAIFMRVVEFFKVDEIGDGVAAVIFDNKAIMQRFVTLFLRTPPIAAGVFNANMQLLVMLAQRNTARMAEYIKSNKGGFIVPLLAHVQQPAMAPFLARLIDLDPMGRTSQAMADANVGGLLLERLTRGGFNECSADDICVCEALSAIISVDLFEGRPIATAPLVKQFCESANVKNLFNFALKSGGDAVNRAEVAFVPINLMLRRCIATTPAAEAAPVADIPLPLRAAFGTIAPVVKTLRSYKTERYFGCHRLQMVEFLCVLAMVGYRHIYTQLIEAGAFAVLLDIFFDRVWLNFVHRLVAETIESLVARGKSSELVLLHLINDLNLPRRCAEAAAANQVFQ